MQLGFAGDELGYLIDLGLPAPFPPSAFNRDPEIKRECIWAGELLRPVVEAVGRVARIIYVERRGNSQSVGAQRGGGLGKGRMQGIEHRRQKTPCRGAHDLVQPAEMRHQLKLW